MSLLKRDFKLSERQQIIAIILLGAFSIVALWFIILLPWNRKRHRLEMQIKEKVAELERRQLLLGEDRLRSKRDNEERYHKELLKQWRSAEKRLASFAEEDVPSGTNVLRTIDFKVELANVRKRLKKKSATVDVSLPFDLGIDEEVRSDEDARKLMLELKAVEKLVDLILDMDVKMIRSIEPLKPVERTVKEGGEEFLEEYPVYVKFYGSIQTLYDLFRVVMVQEQVFVFRPLRVEKVSAYQRDLLQVEAILSGLVFLKDPSEFAPIKIKRSGRTAARGH